MLLGLAILLATCDVLHPVESGENSKLAIKWNSATFQTVRESKLPAPAVARSLAVLHTCMYDAWAAYDDHASGTQLAGALRRPPSERTQANKEKAISYAAYRALSDLFPADINTVYKPLMKELGYDPNDNSTDIETPQGIGNVACAAVLEYRHHDRSNQLGDLAPGAYSDWTHFRAVNMPGSVPGGWPTRTLTLTTTGAHPLSPQLGKGWGKKEHP